MKVCDKTCIFCFFPIVNKYLCMVKRSLLSRCPSYILFLYQYTRSVTSSLLKFVFFFWQGCKNLGCQVAAASKFCKVAPNICEFPERNLSYISLLLSIAFSVARTFLENFCITGLRESLSRLMSSRLRRQLSEPPTT